MSHRAPDRLTSGFPLWRLKGFAEFRKSIEGLTAWSRDLGAVSHLRRVEALVTAVMIIVSREEPNRCRYFRHVFGSEIVFGSGTVDVFLDRRLGQRRQPNHAREDAERRRADRRRCGVGRDLRTLG